MDEKELARWLTLRLTTDRARDDWRYLVDRGWQHFLERKVREVFPVPEIEALYNSVLTKERVGILIHPVIRQGIKPLVREARTDHKKLTRWVPGDARRKIEALVSKRGLVQPKWIKSLFKEKAIEEILADTLYRTLRDFTTFVPRALQKVVPFGKFSGVIGGRLFDEMEKMLEPEIRRFLERGTQRALEGASKFAVDHVDDPTSIQFRRNFVDFVLDQEGAFHVHALTDDVLEDIDRIAMDIAVHVAGTAEARDRLREMVNRISDKHGDRFLRDVFDEIGLVNPPLTQWANATFPAIAAMLQSPDILRWIEALVREAMSVMAEP